LSNVWLDKSFSDGVSNDECRGQAVNKQRRSSQIIVMAFYRPAPCGQQRSVQY
jgi:hypothetical protein